MLAAGAAALALLAAGCAGSSTSSGTTPVKGGTAVWAEPPSSAPTYIFPYMNSANISNVNLFDLQYLIYRPLYWFGQGDQPTVNTSLSLANLPKVSGRTVTITLKHYMWSNGTQVTAQDVMFWLNMELAEPANYGAYTGFPTNVSGHQGGQPDHADHDDEEAVLVDLVPVQRPEPGDPDAGRLGPDRQRPE